jgi:hypothetical protein
VTFTIPKNPGARAVVALFHGTKKIDRGGIMMTASVGTLMTFTIGDDVAMSTGALAVAPPTAASNLAVSQLCTNSGSEPVVAKGMLAIVSDSGQLVGKTALPAHRLLPGERMDVRGEYAGELPRGRYRALMTYDVESKSVSSSASFEVP